MSMHDIFDWSILHTTMYQTTGLLVDVANHDNMLTAV